MLSAVKNGIGQRLLIVAEKFYVWRGRSAGVGMDSSNCDRSVELRTLYLEPSDAFVFVLGKAVSAQTGGAILAVEFLAVKNFVPAFTAFDGSIDELKHKPLRGEIRQEIVDL